MIRTIEQTIMSYAIRYTKLSELVNSQFSSGPWSACDKINIFIDITKLCRSISIDVSNGFSEDPYCICAGILNLCAHYKSFFRRGYNVDTNIYILHSTRGYMLNKKYIKEYCYYGSDNKDQSIVDSNISLLSTICPFIPNVYFISTDHEIGIIIKDILKDGAITQYPSILITKDPYNWQSLYTAYNGLFVFSPIKYRGSDNSYVVNLNNIYERYCYVRQCSYKDDYGINPSLYGLLLSLTRVPERNIKSLMSISSAMKLIKRGIDSYIIPNQYISPTTDAMTYKLFSDLMEGTNFAGYEVNNRLYAIDLYSQYYSLSFASGGFNIQLYDMTDPKGIEMMDNKYFKKSKVDFGTLMV